MKDIRIQELPYWLKLLRTKTPIDTRCEAIIACIFIFFVFFNLFLWLSILFISFSNTTEMAAITDEKGAAFVCWCCDTLDFMCAHTIFTIVATLSRLVQRHRLIKEIIRRNIIGVAVTVRNRVHNSGPVEKTVKKRMK